MNKKTIIIISSSILVISMLLTGAFLLKRDKDNNNNSNLADVPTETSGKTANENVKVTSNEIKEDEENRSISISYPKFDSFELSSNLNEMIEKDNEEWKNKTNQKTGIVMLDKSYNYYISGELLSVVLYSSYYWSEESKTDTTHVKVINVNTKNNKIYEQQELFKKDDYKKELNVILQQKIEASGDFQDEITIQMLEKLDYKIYFENGKMNIYFSSKDLGFSSNLPCYYSFTKDEVKNVLSKDVYNEL